MEILDICDEIGNPTGEVIDREIAHREGILHRTSHVWLLRKRNDNIEILLQRRSKDKDSFPDCFDISSAGHIKAGDSFIDSAVRELKEELGVEINSEQLIDCGNRRFRFEGDFHGYLFKDNQVSKIFVLWLDLEEDKFSFIDQEVSEVKWIEFYACYGMVKDNLIKHCIYLEELDIIKKYLENDYR